MIIVISLVHNAMFNQSLLLKVDYIFFFFFFFYLNDSKVEKQYGQISFPKSLKSISRIGIYLSIRRNAATRRERVKMSSRAVLRSKNTSREDLKVFKFLSNSHAKAATGSDILLPSGPCLLSSFSSFDRCVREQPPL